MTSRERVLAALNHEEPDRVPIDLGGTIMSGIMAHPLDRLRKYLKLEERAVRVYEVFQMLGQVEMDLVERLGIDVLPVEPLVQFFGLRREGYKPWRMFDGTAVEVPGQFTVEVDAAGDLLLHDEGDPSQPVVARMPREGYYFDMASMIDFHADFTPPDLAGVRDKATLSEDELEFVTARARWLRENTDKALVLGCWGYLGLGGVGSIPDFLCLLAADQSYVRELFEIRTEVAVENLKRLSARIGDDVDVVGIDGTDYGSQKAELFSPEWFGDLYVPFFRRQIEWIHENTPWKVWLHSCGSIPHILPHLVEAGLDIINPVQCSAQGMGAEWLKREFGGVLTFWGGGVDTQKTLPFGSPAEVREEVAERIRALAPGGGFVFNPIHNIQHSTPPENILAAFDTVRESGRYPL